MKPILQATRANWIAFRNYDGKQWVYFTHLVTYHCGLKAIQYGVNGAAPAIAFPVPACKAERPLGVDPAKDRIYFTAPLNAVRALTVVVTFADGSRSAPATFEPCAVSGDTTCGKLKP